MKIELEFIGNGRLSELPLYKDQKGNLWGDINFASDGNPNFRKFERYMDDYDDWQFHLSKNESIQDFYENPSVEITLPKSPQAFEYALLDRLQGDCKYFLKNGCGNEKHLWATNVEEHIAKMRELYNVLEIKPQWLNTEGINNFEREMLAMKYK
jgi:hypothetical protein